MSHTLGVVLRWEAVPGVKQAAASEGEKIYFG